MSLPCHTVRLDRIADRTAVVPGAHPLLAQIPLTVSPFISLPTAPTLPYTYKSLPSTLPPSSTGEGAGTETAKPKYVVSPSGHAAHPDEIIASCEALAGHLQKMQDDAAQTLRSWQDAIRDRELAEKRRVAPGWLDREEKILEPQRRSQDAAAVAGGAASPAAAIPAGGHAPLSDLDRQRDAECEALDRAFGGMNVK